MIPQHPMTVTPGDIDEVLGTVGKHTYTKMTLVLRDGQPFCPWSEWQDSPLCKVIQFEKVNIILQDGIRERDRHLVAITRELEEARRENERLTRQAASPAATPLALEVGSPNYAAERAAAHADVNRGTQTVALNQQGKPRKYSTKPIRPCPYCNREDFLDAYSRNGHVGKCKARQPQPVEQPEASLQPAEAEPEIVLQDGEEVADVVALPL